MTEFTWRTDAKAHRYITDNRLSPNQALARYFIGLQAFRFQVEWVPGLKMIADPLSRMVVIAGDGVAMDTKSLVFGDDRGVQLCPPSCALFTLDVSNFPPGSGSPSRCFTKVFTTLSPRISLRF